MLKRLGQGSSHTPSSERDKFEKFVGGGHHVNAIMLALGSLFIKELVYRRIGRRVL